jgi:Flp pilus assembly protein TadD
LVLRRFTDALELLARAEALRPGDPQTAYFRAVVLEEKGEVDAAVAAYDALDADSPLVLDARTRAAAALSRRGAHAAALARLEGLVRERPGALGAAVALAWVYDRAGRTAEGVALLEKLAAGRGAEADVLDALASLYARSGRHADAVALLKSSAAAHPREEKVRYAFASALDRAGRADEALAEMRAVLDLNPDSPDAMNFIGYSLVDRNVTLDDAEKLLQRALELRPENGYITDSLGWLYYRKGDFARATQLLERADQLSPNEPVILDHLGDAYLGAARRPQALDAFRRALGALDKNPDPKIRADVERKVKALAP